MRFFDAAVDHGFVRAGRTGCSCPRTVTVDDAIALATSPVPDTPHKWLDRTAPAEPTPLRVRSRAGVRCVHSVRLTKCPRTLGVNLRLL